MQYIEFLATITGGKIYGIYSVSFIFMMLVYYASTLLGFGKLESFGYGYLAAGLFFVAIPLKILTPATSEIGMIFLTIVWPVWLLQNVFDFALIDYLPMFLTNSFFQ